MSIKLKNYMKKEENFLCMVCLFTISQLGIADPEIQRRLQEEIDRHFVEQKNAQLKAASLERPTTDSKSKDENEEDVEGNKELGEPCTPISSAPEGYEPEVPVHVSAECVVCMDNQVSFIWSFVCFHCNREKFFANRMLLYKSTLCPCSWWLQGVG